MQANACRDVPLPPLPLPDIIIDERQEKQKRVKCFLQTKEKRTLWRVAMGTSRGAGSAVLLGPFCSSPRTTGGYTLPYELSSEYPGETRSTTRGTERSAPKAPEWAPRFRVVAAWSRSDSRR